MTTTMTTCPACGTPKPDDQFVDQHTHATGGETICRACHVAIILADDDLECDGCDKLIGSIETLATELGEADREAFTEEFGNPPTIGQLSDWDATAWGEAWREMDSRLEIEDIRDDAYQVGRLAYLKALFASDAVS